MGQKPLDRFFQPLSHMFASRCKRDIKKASTRGEFILFSPTFLAENEAFRTDFYCLESMKVINKHVQKLKSMPKQMSIDL